MAVQVPTVFAVGVTSNGQGTTPVNIDVPANTQGGDVVIIIAESANTGATITASNYTSLVAQEQAAATGTTILTLLARVLTAAEATTVSVACGNPPLNHWSARSIVIRGSTCTTTSDIVVGAGNQGAAATTGTANGITVANNSLVLMCASTALDAASTTTYSAWTNANLTGITERMDNCVSTNNGGGFGMASGACAGTTTGDSTWTQTSEAWNGVHLGFPPTTVMQRPWQFAPTPFIPRGRSM